MASEPSAAPPSPSKEDSTPETPKAEEAPKPTPSQAKPELAKGERIFASPIAKKIALERGIPLAQVRGIGPEGRIIREDIEKYQPPAAAASAVAATSSAPAASRSEYIDTPVTNMRRVIGSRLTQSKQELPHY
jgi:pyruvate dehydrogenase E2 component (dihydrolipoamide acetyltransferase)